MQPNWQQQQYGGYGQNNYGSNPSFMTSQPTGFPGGGGGFGQQPQQQQQTGFQPQQTGFQPQQTGFQSQPTGFQPQQTGFGQQQQGQRPGVGGGGNLSFLNQPPPSMSSYRTGGGMAPQMTGFVAGGASGLMSQQTGYQPSLMSQPTGFGGGLMSQPTGMGGLRAQPTGFQDPRLQSMMQSFMPSNMSQVSCFSVLFCRLNQLTHEYSHSHRPARLNSDKTTRINPSHRPSSRCCRIRRSRLRKSPGRCPNRRRRTMTRSSGLGRRAMGSSPERLQGRCSARVA